MRRLRQDRSGSSLVEFAVILPIGMLLLAGGMEVGRELAVARKTVRVARAAADLTTQVAQVTTSGVTTILNAAAVTMAPYATTPLGIVVSEITSDTQGRATVTWSKALNATPLTVGTVVTVPTGVAPAGTSVVLGQASYAYTPTFGSTFIPARTISNSIYMRPRLSSTVDLQ